MTSEINNPFLSAVAAFPSHIRAALLTIPPAQQVFAEEIRLRVGQPIGIALPAGERALVSQKSITRHDLEAIMEAATQGSTHAALSCIRNGFVTLRGGHRLGICGSVTSKGDDITSVRHVSSMCLRLAHAVHGVADGLPARVMGPYGPQSTLILSPPGLGKTTLLRDLVRQLSNGGSHGTAFRVALVDERGEVAGCYQGQAELDVGTHTDVLDGCAKARGMVWLLRGMSPQILAVDEITAADDVEAMRNAVGCGAALMATAHAGGLGDLLSRPIYRTLPALFDKVIVISKQDGKRVYDVLDMPRNGKQNEE